MKRITKKSTLALILCLIMVTALFAGCTGTKETKTETTKAPTKTESKKTEITEAPVEEEKIGKITFGTNNFYSRPEYSDMLQDLFLEDTGVELEIRHIPKEGTADKIASMFMAGDFQDIMDLGPVFYRYVVQDYLVDVAPFIQENERIKSIVDANPELTSLFTFGESVYAVSCSNFNTLNVWIREDWRREAGLDMPSSMDEFVDMLKVFRDGDFDGNGIADTSPLTTPNESYNFDAIAAYFGTRNKVYMEDGVAVDPILTPEYKEYLEFMKMLYDEKLIDQELPTNSSWGGTRTKFHLGQAASIIMWADIYDNLTNGLVKNGVEGLDNVAPIPAFDGPNGTFGFDYAPAENGNFITTNAELPQQVFDTFFNWYLDTDNGIISTSRGIEGYSFDVTDGVMIPLESGVGYRGQSLPPVKMGYEYPFKFDPITQNEYDYIIQIFNDYYDNPMAQTTLVPASNENFKAVVGDWKVKIDELFYLYLLGNIDYEEFTEEYSIYKSEIDLDAVIAAIQ